MRLRAPARPARGAQQHCRHPRQANECVHLFLLPCSPLIPGYYYYWDAIKLRWDAVHAALRRLDKDDIALIATAVADEDETVPESPLPVPEGITNIGPMEPGAYLDFLSRSKALLGIMFPTISPTPYLALCVARMCAPGDTLASQVLTSRARRKDPKHRR